MKNLFLALAFTGFVGAVSINTVSAFAPAKLIVGGGEECKKDKKCKKGDACCKSKATASSDKKICSSESNKKCCSHSSSESKATPSQSSGTSEVKTIQKPKEEAK
jgi:hypothetical protein